MSKINVVQKIQKLFGPHVHLVPCVWGTKRPLVPYTGTALESTRSPEYLACLEQERVNIAVYLGKASGGLCAIDLDNDEDLASFLALNPKLACTTRSRGSRGGMVWVQIEGEYPASCNPDHKHFEWRADNRLSMIAGRHPKGMDYVLTVGEPPVRLLFSEIVWPPDWEQPWVTHEQDSAQQALQERFGKPFYVNSKGKVTRINHRYWAGLFAHENRVIYEPDQKAFYQYGESTGLWVPVTQEKVREAIATRILQASREACDLSLEAQITLGNTRDVVTALMGIVEARGVFRVKQPFIHVANGVIRFNSGDITFGEFAPELYSRNRSPFEFDAAAECPRFLNELIYPAMGVDDVSLLQRWLGLVLYGYNLPQRFLILDGKANGGKGTFVRIVQGLVGAENCYQLRTQLLHERFETYRYLGKTLLIGPDVPGDFLMHKGASTLKMLVGGDPMSAEGKGSNADFSMHGTFNIVMTCNSRLRIRLEDDVAAWRRRLLLIRYVMPPPTRRILDFDRILLREEGSGILRWGLQGFVQLHTEFNEIGDFRLTDGQKARIESLLAESDSLRLFIQACLVRDDMSDATTTEFNLAYAEFCADCSWTALPITIVERKAADLMLELLHVPKCHSIDRDGRRSNRGWRRVRIVRRGRAGE